MSTERPKGALSPRLVGDLLARPVGWIVFGVLLVSVLVIGAIHQSAPSRQQRLTYLDSVIKCPPCSGLSIAQSDAEQAKTLRTSVRQWVADGWSDVRIEAKVVSLYGSDEILRPTNPVIWILPLVAIVCGGGGLLVLFLRRSRQVRVPLGAEDELLVQSALQSKDDP